MCFVGNKPVFGCLVDDSTVGKLSPKWRLELGCEGSLIVSKGGTSQGVFDLNSF
jgi:hypothetical protein